MKKLLWFFLLLLVSLWLGLQLKQDAGYVLVVYQDWTLETPVWVAVLLLLLIFVILHLGLNTCAWIKRAPGAVRSRWQALRRAWAQRPSRQQRQAQVMAFYQHLLQDAAAQHAGLSDINRIWWQVPRKLKAEPVLLNIYANLLIAHNEHGKAERLIRWALKKHWHAELIHLYALLQSPKPVKQLALAEKWLQSHPNDPALLLALGKLCLREQLWGKARDYLQLSIQLTSAPESYQELGEALEKLGAKEQAEECYRRGLRAALQSY